MTSRERVIRAITFREPDRVPVHHYVFPGVFWRYGDALIRLLEEYPDDFGNNNVEQTLRLAREEKDISARQIIEYRDEWGTLWRRLKGYTSGEVVEPALPTWDRWGDYQFPLPLPNEYFEEFKKDVERRHPQYYAYGHGGSIFHQVQFIRGSTNVLLDLAEDCGEVYELMDRLVEFHIKHIKGYLAAGVDGIFFGDDWGTQTALFINPAMWRTVFKPRYKKMFDIIKNAGKHIFFHSDGWILEILDDLAEIGVNVINSQHHIMGNAEVAGRIRGKMCLRSDLDRQHILPAGTPKEVTEHIKEIVALFGNQNGGLILHGEVGSDVPFDNIKAMYHAFRKYGHYPLKWIRTGTNHK